MNALKLTSLAVLALAAGVAQAQAIRIAVPDDVALPMSMLTRAEVLADFHLWRLAGLQDLNRGDAGPELESPEYRRAQAKYAFLRASPQYAALVEELSRRPNATVLAGKAAAEPLASSGSNRSR